MLGVEGVGGGAVRGGNIYWGRRDATDSKGIAVIFSWVSIQERYLSNYVDLYSSLGWDSLVCSPHFLTAFHSERALSLAILVLNELVEELKTRPCPVVFVAFSAGPKACMSKVVQIIEGACEGKLYPATYRLLRNCISGHIYDSGPVDVTSDFGMRFALHPTVLKMPGPTKLVSWVARYVASGLDALYLTRFESLDAEYWQALYSSVNLGAPFLILCSEKDELAPFQSICSFAQRLQDLGGDVKLVNFYGSPHVGHYKYHPIQYRAAVTNLLEQAALVYHQKIRQLELDRTSIEGMQDEISELICDLQKAAVNSNQSFERVALGPSDHFFLPSSAEHDNSRDSESGKEKSVHLPSPPSINAHSVLGQVLFDVCVPKNVEGWDVKFSGSLNGRSLSSARKPSPLNGRKCIPRSKL
ncbi:Transmembrane protein 53 [Quillaja saponaria]|uniref:Transmembrane protein 53 n=1 Tax=Quillaja saponaria TaxID=32244 RepID=A0AAD7LZY3_QUISA|nr:Transmembrane protein 53 [Quillaja saponaria]